jgi:short-subunit dehydrogenase
VGRKRLETPDRLPFVSVLDGKVLVTGATGGIGQAIARALHRHGATLILTGRRAEVLEPLARDLSAQPVLCDLSKQSEVGQLLLAAGDVDVLVANAALPASGALVELTQQQIDRMLEVNLRAPIALARGLAPAMIERGRGHLVFISSLSGKAASPASSIYSATKFGLRGFALGIREDLRPHGVGVSVILPGFIRDAGMFAESGAVLPRGLGTRTPDEVAQAVLSAIEHNRAEVQVAPLHLRLGASFATVVPELAATVSRRLGADRISSDLAARQRAKR